MDMAGTPEITPVTAGACEADVGPIGFFPPIEDVLTCLSCK